MPSNAERLLAGLAALALLAPVAAGAAVEPRFEEYEDRYELGNDDISVWFQGKKPLLKVFPAGNESRSYQVHMLRVAEFQDEDGDRAYDENESAAYVNLAQADEYDVETRSEDGAVHVTMNLNTTIQPRAAGGDITETQPPLAEEPRANITLEFHVYDSDRVLDGNVDDLEVSSSEVKFDLEVHQWDWTTEDGRLAMVAEVPTDNRTDVQARNDTERLDVEKNGTEIGYTAWQDEARIQTHRGNETVDVVPSIKTEEGGQDGNGTVVVALAYDAQAGYQSLVHDPTVGVTDGGSAAEGLSDAVSDVPGPGAALLAAAAVGAAAVAGRRDR